MNRTNLQITAAVAAALASGAVFATTPTFTQIGNVGPSNTIYIAGSSAIKNALSTTIVNTFCNGSANTTVITTAGTGSQDKNWLAFACTPRSGEAANSGIYFVSYRFEGGSVAGYLPIVNESNPAGAAEGVNFISGSGLTSSALVVAQGAETNGQNDQFTATGGNFVRTYPDLGIGDVEPKAITNNNYPTDYCTTVFGAVNETGMFGTVPSGLIADEVYALFVNEASLETGQTATTFTENPLNLSVQTVSNIMAGNITDWSQVADVNGNAVVNASTPITVVNREFGSGSRTATDILIVGDSCGSNEDDESIVSHKAQTRYFSTGDVLAAAGTVAGAITYATIDNNPATNLTIVTLNNVAPSNLNAAYGTYPFWVEAAYLTGNPRGAGQGTVDSEAVNNIIAGLQNQQTTAALADINGIPNIPAANAAETGVTNFNTVVHANPANSGLVPSGGGTATVYINPWTRADATCHNPESKITTFD